eukprot:62391-Prorocentrum_minimum.AAC.1
MKVTPLLAVEKTGASGFTFESSSGIDPMKVTPLLAVEKTGASGFAFKSSSGSRGGLEGV